jgi:hypothetical protein
MPKISPMLPLKSLRFSCCRFAAPLSLAIAATFGTPAKEAATLCAADPPKASPTASKPAAATPATATGTATGTATKQAETRPADSTSADAKPADSKPAKKSTGSKNDPEKAAAAKLADEKRREEEARRKAADEVKRREDEAKKKAADDARRMADEVKRKADEAKREEERKKAEEARIAKEAQMKAEAEARAAREAQMKAEADARAAARVISDRAEAMVKVKITRTPDDVFQAVARWNAGAEATATEPERYLLYVQAGQWAKLGDLIRPFPADQALRLYGKVLNDLQWANPKPMLLSGDVLQLADASPADLDDKQVLQIGKLLGYAVAKNESRTELAATLEKGTKRLGGTDADRRRAAARMFASAEFWNEAKQFGLKDSEIPAVVAQAKAENPAKLADDAWNRLLGLLANRELSREEREEHLSGLHQVLVQATPESVAAKLGALVREKKDLALVWEIVALVGRKTAIGQTDFDYEVRGVNLELQAAVVRLLAGSGSVAGAKPLEGEPARTFVNLFARNWLSETPQTLLVYPTWKKSSPETRPKYPHVGPEILLAACPRGAWLGVLEPQLALAVKTAEARLVIQSDNIDRLPALLAGFSVREKAVAAELANAYLLRWAELRKPTFTEAAAKQYKADSNVIVLTRAEQAASLRQLAVVLEKIDAETRKLVDDEMLVTAFDLCHSKAEPYTFAQVEQVFGPVADIPPALLLKLTERMRKKLGSDWREMSVQRDAATRRDLDDVFQMVNDGYAEGEKILTAKLSKSPGDWQIHSLAGSLYSDWAEFAYFQATATGENKDRFSAYLERTAKATDRFRASAKAYAAAVPKLKRDEFSHLPYKAWFYGLLGISDDAGVNVRKGVSREGLKEIREAIEKLPGGAGGVHLGLFSKMVADNLTANLIDARMKFRYLSSAVEITGRSDTVYPAQEKVQYYESLLEEIRLRARIDGDARIPPDGQFGVFVTLVHTADLARESGGFGKYLQNEVRKNVTGKDMEKPLYRDRFEDSLRIALGDFFEIKAIVFADPNAGARPMIPDRPAADTARGDADEAAADEPGAASDRDTSDRAGGSPDRDWQETPLAYLHLAVKDPTVDMVPPLEIDLDFFDRDGKVIIPVPSQPVLIEIAEGAPSRRPADKVEITQIVDARELATNKRLKMDIVATSHGLVPDLEELIDVAGYELAISRVDHREDLHVDELHSGDDGLYAVSSRNWTVELDPTPILTGASTGVDFQFPKPTSDQIAVTYRAYKDMDPVAAAEKIRLLEGAEAEAAARPNYLAWSLGAAGALLVVGLAAFLAQRNSKTSAAVRPPLFDLPRESTPFAVLTLLNRIRTSPDAALNDAQRAELAREITTIERSAFADGAAQQPTTDLRSLAARWIAAAQPS